MKPPHENFLRTPLTLPRCYATDCTPRANSEFEACKHTKTNMEIYKGYLTQLFGCETRL